MSLTKKILFFLVFLFAEFFMFKSGVSAEYICSPYLCTRGYESRYDPDLRCPGMNYCVFTGCHGINGLNYNDGATNVTSEACFETGESYCYAWPTWADSTVAVAGDKFSPLPNEDIGSCSWHYDSKCECLGGGDGFNWKKHGSGCVGNLACNTSNGWYSTCDLAWGSAPTGDCWYSYSKCKPCGNSGRACYRKDTSGLTITCTEDAFCGSGRCCKNPGTTSSYCSSSCGSTPPTPTPTPAPCVCQPKSTNPNGCSNLGGTCGSPSRPGTIYTGLCTCGDECVCVVPCVPNCSASGTYCSGQTFTNGCGGTCTGTKTPDCSASNTVCSGTNYAVTCGTCAGTKAIVANDIGTCGTAQTSGAAYSVAPSGSALCADNDTPSLVTTNTTTYTWSCTGVAGTCVTAQNLTTNCSAIRDNPPTFTSFYLRNTDSAVNIPIDLNNSNHICQSTFTTSSNPTTARFVVTYTDLQGGGDIASIRLRLGTQIFTDNTLTVSGNNATASFDIPISSVLTLLNNLYSIETSASDINTYTGSVAVFANTNPVRNFKFWNCSVSSSGTGYDSSANGATCGAASFDPSKQITFPYTLSMVDTPTVNMTVSSPNYSGTLVWGKSYIFSSNVPGANFKLRFNNDDATCTNTTQFDVNNTKANPYNNPVQLDIDFTSILDQDPWWQSIDGGVISNTSINNQVPVTCVSNCKISTNALVATDTLYNSGIETDNVANIKYIGSSAKLANVNENYIYFKDQYYNKNQIGTLSTGTKTVTTTDNFGTDPNNIYFIDGDLNINGNLTLGTRKFLMIIVSGNITISQSVTQVDGIFVAKNIYATGTNATRLTINGSLYASDSVEFTRGFTTGSANNTAAAVVVDHNPSLLFNIPGKLAKVLTSWQWGN